MTRRATLAAWLGLTVAAACSSPTGPGDPGIDPGDKTTDQDTATVLPATGLTDDDLSPSGEVTQTEDGFTVKGSLGVAVDDTTSFEFVEADLRVRKDEQGNVTSISGTAQIPSPHERIEFEDPVRAQVGFFTGAYLNDQGEMPILLHDTIDYFVFDVGLAFQMNIATGETGEDAVKPISIKLPVGGRALMIIDYTDPMYYVYGAQDLIGEGGMGWSFRGRIPFEPSRPVAGLGSFEARNVRTGGLTLKKIFKISGQTVDNRSVEVHLSEPDPYDNDVSYGYEVGYDGTLELDLGYKDVFGVGIPLADASGGYRYELSVQEIFEGYAYASGATADFSWWPTFIPIKPASSLEVEVHATNQLDYGLVMAGQYGWEFPDGLHAMGGTFSIVNEVNTFAGQIVSAAEVWEAGGGVTKDATRLYVDPPQSLLDALSTDVNDEVLPRIDEAEKAWNDLQDATADYELELSLRGLRTQLPGIADRAAAALSSGIEAELKNHEGEVYYSSLKSHLYAADNDYYASLDNLKAQARQATDNAQTRAAIEAALRDVAAKKIFRTTYRYYIPNPFGDPILVKEVKVTRRIMSDSDANRLIEAANNVYRIKETSDIKISMQQIYDEVDDRELFEQVRDDIRDGLLVMRDIGELGLTYAHTEPSAFVLHAVIDGTTYPGVAVSALSVAEMLKQLPDMMIEALKVN